MNLNNDKIIRLISVIFIVSITFILKEEIRAADADTIFAPEAIEAPVVDGQMDDACWQTAEWNSLNHVWMEWEETVDSADYYGRFKVVWSAQTQLMYVLVEVTDDVLIERYAEIGNTAHYNDIVEVFLDEDASGGNHVFDGTSADWGYNAENAFSYHVAPLETPEEGGVVNLVSVFDLDGTGWGDSHGMEYADHLPEFALRKTGNQYTWEFSLIVYTDLYETDSPDGTEALLQVDKVMGLALAYCETDSPDTYHREMFLGSYPGIETILTSADDNYLFGYNDAWKNADHYNVCVLTGAVETDIKQPGPEFNGLDVFFVPVTNELRVQFSNQRFEDVNVSIHSLDGKMLQSGIFRKPQASFTATINVLNAAPGMYLVMINHDRMLKVSKILIQ